MTTGALGKKEASKDEYFLHVHAKKKFAQQLKLTKNMTTFLQLSFLLFRKLMTTITIKKGQEVRPYHLV